MKTFWIPFSGMSMHPFLKDKDELLVSETCEWKVGDLVLYRDKESRELTVHRIISSSLQTKGDYSLCLDQNSPEDFLGKVTAFKRNGVLFSLENSRSQATMLAFFSRLRLKGWVLRKIGLMGLTFVAFWPSGWPSSNNHSAKPQ